MASSLVKSSVTTATISTAMAAPVTAGPWSLDFFVPPRAVFVVKVIWIALDCFGLCWIILDNFG
jgi:hypothetical protein